MVEILRLNEPVTSIVEIESHVISTRCASLFRALSREDGTAVTLWESRARVPPEAEKEFLSRLEQISRLKLPNCPIKAFGIDSDERGFAILAEIETTFLVTGYSGKVDLREAERRFAPCLQIISRMHQAGIVLGDISSHSFVLDRSGRVQFIGVMGDVPIESYQEDLLAEIDSIPPEIFQYMAPEQRDGYLATQQSDVFALGVLGYRLFGGQYPFAKIPKENLISPIEYPEEIPSIPASKSPGAAAVPGWCNEVFKRAMHVSPLVRFVNAEELGAEIIALRQKAIAEAELPADHRAALEAPSKFAKQAEGAQKFESPKLEKDIPEDPKAKLSKKQSHIIIFAGSFFAIIVGLLLANFFVSSKKIPLDLDVSVHQPEAPKSDGYQQSLQLLAKGLDGGAVKEAASQLESANLSIQEAEVRLNSLVKSSDGLADKLVVLTAMEHPKPEVSQIARKLIINNFRNSGFSRSSELINAFLAGENKNPEIAEALLTYANPRLAIKEREVLLRRIYPLDPSTVVNLAAASALDSGNLNEFQPVLAQLVGDILREKDAASYSAIALMLAEPQVSSLYEEDLFQYKDQLGENDLLWLINVFSKREDRRLRAIAEIAIERLKLKGWRQEFLQILSQKDDLTQGVTLALINSAIAQATIDDVGQLAGWIDPLSNRALIAVCAENTDPEILIKAFDTLAAKPLPDDYVFRLIQLIRNKYWERRGELTVLVPAVAGNDQLNAELNPRALDSFAAVIKDTQLIKYVFQSSNVSLLTSIVDRFGAELDLTVLLDLLSHPDPQMRIKAVTSLKGYNDAISLNLITDKFKKEKDPEVIKHYKQTFWSIAERYQ